MNEPVSRDVGRATDESALGWFIWACLGLTLVLAIFLRVWKLDHLPAVNGDECWYGNFALDALNGRSPSFLTPNRNPVNPFYILPVIAAHAVAAPSILLLRSLPALFGMLTLGVNFIVARRLLGLTAAVASTWLLAVMAITIAYSRFAWDASQLPLATALVMYASVASQRRPGWFGFVRAWGMLGVAVLIHPTCIFLGPIVFLSTQTDWLGFLKRCFGPEAPRSRQILGIVLLAAIGIGGLALAGFWLAGRRVHSPTLSSLFAFVQLFADLFTGRTTYIYISGAPCESNVWWVAGIVFLVALGCALGVHRNSGRTDHATLVSGYLAGLVLFYVIAGPGALRPGYERYGVFLISPTVILISMAIAERRYLADRRAMLGFCVLCLALLGQFQWCYVRFLETTGGESAATFHTAAADPKLTASELIRERSPSSPGLVIVRDFHIWQSLRYYLSDAPHIRIERVRTGEEAQTLIAQAEASSIWIVSFGKPDDNATDELPEFAASLALQKHKIPDFPGRPAVVVFGTGE